MSDTTMKAIATQIKEATAAGTNTAAKVGGLLENLCDEKLHEDYSAHIGNIKRYGAVGNGSTDDTAAFTAALADSTIRTIYIPNGTYLCDGFTIADAAPKNIIGESMYGATLKLKSAATQALITLASGLNNVEIANLTLMHLSNGFSPANEMTGTDGVLLYLANQNYNINIHDVYFYQFTNCAININNNLSTQYSIVVNNCVFYNQFAQGVYPAIYLHDSAEYTLITGCNFSSIAGALYLKEGSGGAIDAGAKNNVFANNICMGCGDATYPVVYSYANNTRITGNTINHSLGDAIVCKNGTGSGGFQTVANNNILAMSVDGTAAIKLQGVGSSIVSGNVVRGVAAGGELTGCPCLTIEANGALASSYCIVTGNIFYSGAVTIPEGQNHVTANNVGP